MYVYGCLNTSHPRLSTFFILPQFPNLFVINSRMLPSISKILFRRVSRTGITRTFSAVPSPNKDEKPEGTAPVSTTGNMPKEVLESKDYFQVHNIFSVKAMFDAKVHFGHKRESLDDRMKPFIFGSRLGHIIFDLDIAAYHLRKALNFCAHIAYRDGVILFVSHNKRCSMLVEDTAAECKEFAFTKDWLDGLLTNSSNLFRYEVRLPDLCILLNTNYETGQQHRAVVEAAKLLIPTIGVVDSNTNPNLVTYPVPGNDDTPSSVAFFCRVFKEAILRGKKMRQEHIKAGLIS